MTANEIKGHLSMFCANLIWGLMSPFAKLVISAGTVTALSVTGMRIGGAMVLFWLASLFTPNEKVPPADLLRLFVAALLGIVFNQGFFIFGVGLTSPADASIITTSMPLWAMILAAFILKEPVTAKKIAGIAAGAAGAIILICSGSGRGSAGSDFIKGDLLVLAAQFSYALYLVIYKNFVARYSLFTVMKWMFTFAFVCVLPFSARGFVATQWGDLSLSEIAALVFIVVAATFLSYALIVVGQRNLRPTVAGMYNYLQPVVACLVAVFLGMDNFTCAKLFAVLLIFSGVFLVTRSKSRADIDSCHSQKNTVRHAGR